MIIDRIELENWMSYPKRWPAAESNGDGYIVPTIEFARDLTLITGASGAGKSAILEAICYALFAKYPRANRNEVAIHSGESGAKVRLFFTLPTGKGDAKYCVERLLSSKKG
ncbi:MAG: AAA family ATPase, partial [bacterium]